MKKHSFSVFILALFAFAFSACTQEEMLPESENGIAAKASGPQVLGHVTENGFVQTATENELLAVMGNTPNEDNNYIYLGAEVAKNGRLYMIKFLAKDPDSDWQGNIWTHLEVDNDDIVLPTERTTVVCDGEYCSSCTYQDTGNCYFCFCSPHGVGNENCEEFYIDDPTF